MLVSSLGVLWVLWLIARVGFGLMLGFLDSCFIGVIAAISVFCGGFGGFVGVVLLVVLCWRVFLPVLIS